MTDQELEDGQSQTLIDRSYEWDNAGNLISVDDHLEPLRERVFTYDDMGRLEHATGPFGDFDDIAYAYDDIGSRETRTLTQGLNERSETFHFVGTTPVIDWVEVEEGNATVPYDVDHDAAGNLIQDEWTVYAYTPRGTLRSRTPIGGGIDDAWTFGYDAAGLRARSTPPGIAWEETRHYLLPDGSPFYEAHYLGSPVPRDARSFVFVGGRLLAVIGHVFDGEKIVSEAAHVASDHIGFPVMTLDADGVETWQARDVLPFGEIAVATGDADPLLRYPGQWAMPGPSPGMTELLSNGYRWYRPGWGRYSQSDPVGHLTQQQLRRRHLYAYAEDNPLALIDPLGLDVHNNGTKPICIKPEDGPGPVVLAPGETYSDPVDGVSDMDGDVIKIPDPYNDSDIDVSPDGVNLPGPDFIANLLGGGKLDCPPDDGWKPLFECAKGQ